ncbi:MAG: tetratricopeptide repeat protein [Candidatus Binatia bacterium]
MTGPVAYAKQGPSLQQNSGWEQGKRYLAEGKASEAREVFEDLLKSHPKEPEIHLFLAIALLRMRDVQAAEVHIRQALVLAPDHAEARTLLGWINLEVRRDYSSAIEEYVKVVRLKPGLPEGHNNLGVANRKSGDSEMALASFDRALALRDSYSEAWSNRGWVSVEQKNWQAARNDFERALQINPGDEGALYGMAQVLRATRDYAGAQQALKRAMVQSPNFVYWLEWSQLQLVRYYWLLLLVACAFFLQVQYRKARARRKSNGG